MIVTNGAVIVDMSCISFVAPGTLLVVILKSWLSYRVIIIPRLLCCYNNLLCFVVESTGIRLVL